MSASRPSFPVRRSKSRSAIRRRLVPRRRGSLAAAEALESRALLAVTALLAGNELQISLGAADDVAYLTNDGTNYIVRGSGLSGYAAAIASVNSIAVAGTQAANQSFTVAAGVGDVLTDPLTVAASVESASIVGGVNTTGDLLIDSASITLASDITTTGQQRFKGAVGLVGTRTLSAGAGNVTFESTVDSSPALFADADAFAMGSALTTAYPGITISAVGTDDAGVVVTSAPSHVLTPTTGLYAPTGNRVFAGTLSDGSWNAPANVCKFEFAESATSVSLDFAPNDDFDPNAFLEAYDAAGNLLASATYPDAIPELSFVTLTVSAPNIAYVLASFDFDPEGGNTGLLDNLRATLATTPAASLTVNTSGTTSFAGVVGGGTPLTSLTTDSGGTTQLAGAAVTTVDNQVYNDDSVLATNVSLTTTTGDIDFKKTVNGGYTLTIDAGNDVFFRGKVGDGAALAGIALKAAQSVTAANTVRLDGTTPRAGGTATPFADGLTIYGGVNNVSLTKEGSEIRNFTGNGIVFLGGSTGSTVSGFTIRDNGGDGVLIGSGDYPGTAILGNEIYSNTLNGVFLNADSKKLTALTITGNKIGTLADGTTLRGNGRNGIEANEGTYTSTKIQGNTIAFNAHDGISLAPAAGTIAGLTIGGDKNAGEGNTIYSNLSDGIQADKGDYTATRVEGNSIYRNTENGIYLKAAGDKITNLKIGGDKTAGEGNSIYENTSDGIQADDGVYTGTAILGNEIYSNLVTGVFLNADGKKLTALVIGGGEAKFGNRIENHFNDGILVGSKPGVASDYSFTLIGSFNEIVGNGANGIELLSAGATGLTITGNKIGTLADGTTARGNGRNGIEAKEGTYTSTKIQGNTIAFNKQDGISLAPAAGTIAGLTIGGDKTAGEGNAIYGNFSDGIEADAGTYTGTVIQGNVIGSQAINYTVTANGTQVTVTGDLRSLFVIGQAVAFYSPYTGSWELRTVSSVSLTGGNTVLTISSALDAVTTAGTLAIGNVANGIHLDAATGTISGLTIGGNSALLGNAIYANTQDGILVGAGTYTGTTIGPNNDIGLNYQHGIELAQGGAASLTIKGNFIGTLDRNLTDSSKGNTLDGIRVNAGGYAGTSIASNTIGYNDLDGIRLAAGGTTITGLSVTDNSIGGNGSDGVQADNGDFNGTVIAKNVITANRVVGIRLAAGGTTLTGLSVTDNDISFNFTDGVRADNGDFNGTVIRSNVIGLNRADGIHLAAAGDKITNLTIGGDKTAAEGNKIYGNGLRGIYVGAGTYTGTVIQGNEITGNTESGISLAPTAGTIANLTIGGDKTAGEGNAIYGNGFRGINVGAGTYTGTVIQGNEITGNTESGILLNANSGAIGGLLVGGDPAVSLGNEVYLNGAATGLHGIATTAGDFTDTKIVGNTIRDNGDKTKHVGNGILVLGRNLLIGGAAQQVPPDSKTVVNTVANTITGNARNGVEIRRAEAAGNTILSNAIYLNGYVGPGDGGGQKVSGEGISLVDGGNAGQAAPVILRVVDDQVQRMLDVAFAVPGSGSYAVQFFVSTPADERGLFPADRAGFEGRTLVAQRDSVAGDALAAVRIPSNLVPAGSWLTATATAMAGTIPTNTSGFSEAMQVMDAPSLAVGSGGPPDWVREYTFTSSGSSIRITGLSPGMAASLAALKNEQITVTGTATKWSEVTAISSLREVVGGRVAGNAVVLSLKSGAPLPPRGTMVVGARPLPAARLYDASLPNSNVEYTVTPGGTQLTLSDDQPDLFVVGQKISITPTTPTAGESVTRFITAVTASAGSTLLTLHAAIDATNTAGTLTNLPTLDVGAEQIKEALESFDGEQTSFGFTVRAGGTWLTLGGDRSGTLYVGQTVSVTPVGPAAQPAVVRTIAGLRVADGNTLVRLSAPIDGRTTAGTIRGTVTPQAAGAFINRFQGGFQVARGDVDGDGYDDLVTATGPRPATQPAAVALAGSVGSVPRIVTIYNGNANGSWMSASIDVSGQFGTAPTWDAFFVTFGNVRAESPGTGDALKELVVASRTRVVTYNIAVAGRGARPTFDTPETKYDGPDSRRITSIAAGDFSAAPEDSIVVVTTTVAKPTLPTRRLAGRQTAFVSVIPPTGSGREFSLASYVEDGPRTNGRSWLQNVFYNGGSMSVGDVDGQLTLAAGRPVLKPELVLGAWWQGFGNFRVLANDLVASGTQGQIYTALAPGNEYTGPVRYYPFAGVSWQPTGGPDYFTGIANLAGIAPPTDSAYESPVSVAVVDSVNGVDARAQVFAALGPGTWTQNSVRKMRWNGTAWTGPTTIEGGMTVDPVTARPSDTGAVVQTRFAFGTGLRLG